MNLPSDGCKSSDFRAKGSHHDTEVLALGRNQAILLLPRTMAGL